MLKVFSYEGGKTIETTLFKISQKKNVWIDIKDPSDADILKISDITSVPNHYINECLDEDERPRVTDFGKYSVILFRAPQLIRNETRISTVTFIVTSEMLISLHKGRINGIERLLESSDEKKERLFSKGSGYLLFLIIDEFIKDMQKKMEEIEEEITKLESSLFSKKVHDTTKIVSRDIFKMKKALIYFRKTFATNRDVIAQIEKGYAIGINKKCIQYYRDHYNDLIELIDMEGIYSNLLTGALEIYLSLISNNLNEIMKRLTVITAFVLIPTLITGIYGMNFKIMPETTWVFGYPFAIILMTVSVLLVYFFFKKQRWL
ncbi:magnesium/cobalt transporter CorA [Candidatus Woesearchaeota archaeon]|nr:magnesium/cobalt transporter CorA [Candidatus Woesearchaeota archaeon]